MAHDISIILPAKNEADSLRILLPKLRQHYPEEEIIVVNDGSIDNTAEICKQHQRRCRLTCLFHGQRRCHKDRGAKRTGDILVFMDADGQHNPEDITRLGRKAG